MEIEIKCVPTKEVFSNYLNGFRVVSCIPTDYKSDIKLNRYGNFTVSGSNVSNLKIGQEANLIVSPDESSKYDGSYIMIGYAGVKAKEEEIEVDPRFELEILSRLMEENQAKNVNTAYPRFVNMVLNGQEEEISYKDIYNVGVKRLPEYIQKVKDDCKNILFYPVATKAGIGSPSDIKTLQSSFDTPEELQKSLDNNPYNIYMDLLHFPFAKSDELVLKTYPELRDSQVRCEYGCLEILRENELDGDTRLDANIMASEARKLMPESYHHMVKAVTESKIIHYDPETKYAAIQSTWEDEKLIAETIKEKMSKPIESFRPMDWQNYKEVDGFDCTDEQMEILKIVGEGGRVGILTGSGGSGKTSSIKALIRMLEGNYRSYTLLAPTGVAAKRMRESTGRQASTIHMFLTREEIPGEYVIIDEMSMVSVQLLAKLLRSLEPKTNLIFVCDEAQLASISCGNIVQDLIDSGVVPRANLTKIFRYGVGGIATIATDARFGTMENLSKPFDDFKFVPINSDPIGQVLKEYDKLIEKGYKKDEILVLSPYNKGTKGTYEINKAIQSRFNPNDYSFASYERKPLGKITFKVGDRVLNTHNNYHMPCIDFDEEGYEVFSEMPCMNGDLGIVREVRGHEKDPMLIVEFDNGVAAISKGDIGNLLLGYSVSVHKVQGAQAKAVIVVIDKEHKRLLTRNLEYVAFSRAQKDMVVIADENALGEGLDVQENMERDTWLGDMLKEQDDE